MSNIASSTTSRMYYFPVLCTVPQKEYNVIKWPHKAVVKGDLAPISIKLPDGFGISIREAMSTKSSQIVGANEPVIGKVKYHTIKLFVNWPGYSGISSIENVNIMIEGGSVSITLAMLVTQAARQISKVMSICARISCSEKWAAFKIRSGYSREWLSPNNVYLVGLNNTVDGVWQVNLDAYIYPKETPSSTADGA